MGIYIDASRDEVKESIKEDLKYLTQYEVTPNDEFKTGKAKRLYPKHCYRKAFEYVSAKRDIEGIKLVHGLYRPSFFDNHCGHAWVNLPNQIIFDGVLQLFYDKEGYYDFYQIVKQREYNSSEMYRIRKENGGHYGPWHDND